MPYKDPAQQKVYYQANRERILQREKARYADHPERQQAYSKQRYQAKKEFLNAQSKITSKKRREKLRREILQHYSRSLIPFCNCCGETTEAFLSIDHVNGGGNQHKKQVGRHEEFYRWIIQQGFPPGFQILCHNCNQAKGTYGECPHQVEKREFSLIQATSLLAPPQELIQRIWPYQGKRTEP